MSSQVHSSEKSASSPASHRPPGSSLERTSAPGTSILKIASEHPVSYLLNAKSEDINRIISYLPTTALLCLKQVNRQFHSLIAPRTQHLDRQQIAEYLRWEEECPETSAEKEKGELTCYICLSRQPQDCFVTRERSKKKGCDNAYGRVCIICMTKYPRAGKNPSTGCPEIRVGFLLPFPDDYPAVFCEFCASFKFGAEVCQEFDNCCEECDEDLTRQEQEQREQEQREREWEREWEREREREWERDRERSPSLDPEELAWQQYLWDWWGREMIGNDGQASRLPTIKTLMVGTEISIASSITSRPSYPHVLPDRIILLGYAAREARQKAAIYTGVSGVFERISRR
ncbi:MAG: hypothetical protein M1834_001212 [Cirrosporium novae-zelandiae]|nr:MAG: hypothetical protein M1834_001212 [Cirrosporium novae-zelandiae]